MNLRYLRVLYPGECAACGRAFEAGDEALTDSLGAYFCNDACFQLDDDRGLAEADHEAELGEQLYDDL